MDPELYAVFCEEFVAATNRLRSAAGASWAAKETELSQSKRALERLVQALIDGAPASSVTAKMEELEAKYARLEGELANRAAPPPALDPNLASVYREKVSNPADALSTPEAQADAAQSLRGLIDKIVLTPQTDGYSIDLQGDLAGILTVASVSKSKTAEAFGPLAVKQFELVAGVGFEPTTFRL